MILYKQNFFPGEILSIQKTKVILTNHFKKTKTKMWGYGYGGYGGYGGWGYGGWY